MQTKFSGTDKREYPRFKVDFPLEVLFDNSRVMTKMKDISCSGIFCRADRFIPVKTRLEVRIGGVIPRGKKAEVNELTHFGLRCAAEVARIEPASQRQEGEYDIGLVFSRIGEEEKNFIIKFVRQRNIKESKELRRMYFDLNEMVGYLVELEKCHPTADRFRKVINKAIEELDDVAQILDHEITELEEMGSDGR